MGSNPDHYRSDNDPYNDMASASEAIKPGFISGSQLSDAEKTATQGHGTKSSPHKHNTKTSTTDQLRNQEQSTFINSVRGLSANSRSRQKSGKSSNSHTKTKLFRRYGPIGAILGLVFSGGLFFYFSQSLLGPHIQALVTQNTDYQYTPYALRNTRLFRYVMDGDGKVKITPFTKKYKTFSPYLKERLRSKGIEVGRLDADGKFSPDKLVSTDPRVLRYKDEIIDANAFTDKMASDVDFREAYYSAKRGRLSNFFDPVAMNHYTFYGETRDNLHDFKSTGDKESDSKQFKDTITQHVSGSDFTANTAHPDKDEDGNDITAESGEETSNKNVSGDTPEAKAKSFVNSLSGKVSSVGVPLCGALRVVNIAAVTISAYQILQGASYFMGMTEPISKAMAGNGSGSGVNEMLNFFTTPETSVVNYVDAQGHPQEKEFTGAPIESAGAKLILGETQPSKGESDAFAVDNITRAARNIALSQGVTATTCNGVTAASALLSLGISGIPGGTLASIAVSVFMETVGGIVMTVAVAALINAIMPQVIHIFTDNVFDSYQGIQAGNLYFLGASAANGRLAQDGSALMPASEDRVKEQNRNTVIALANEAELSRKDLSPFDPTNEHTFLGSIFAKFSPFSFSRNHSFVASNLATIVGDSIQSLTPGASAADQANMYTSFYQECVDLPGAMCDFYGLPIPTADLSTIDTSPDDPLYQSIINKNLDAEGKIKDNSELAKFINFCSNRQSPWGVQDANILNALQTDGGIIVNNLPVVGDIIDVINAAEDQANVDWATGKNCINSADNPRWDNEFKYYQLYIQDMRILDTMKGQESSNSSNHLLTADDLAQSNLVAQNQSTATSQAPRESDSSNTNPVLAYEQHYLETHPLDHSPEGTLARISGNTKEDILYLRFVAEYSQMLADYHPEERFAFHNEIKSVIDPLQNFELHHTPNQSLLALEIRHTPILTDKRNYLL